MNLTGADSWTWRCTYTCTDSANTCPFYRWLLSVTAQESVCFSPDRLSSYFCEFWHAGLEKWAQVSSKSRHGRVWKKRTALVLRKASGSCSCKDNQGFLVLSVIHFVHFVQTVLLGGCDLSHYRMDASKSALDFRSGYWTKWIMREKLNLCSPVQWNYIRHVENV